MTLARGVLIAFLWTISVALCPLPRILPFAWCTPPVMSKALNWIILTPATVPLGCTCIVAYAAPPCSSVTMIPECTNYIGSCLILPCGVQYNDWLYPSIPEPWNHHGPLIDPATGELCLMEVVGDFRATDPIFKRLSTVFRS